MAESQSACTKKITNDNSTRPLHSAPAAVIGITRYDALFHDQLFYFLSTVYHLSCYTLVFTTTDYSITYTYPP